MTAAKHPYERRPSAPRKGRRASGPSAKPPDRRPRVQAATACRNFRFVRANLTHNTSLSMSSFDMTEVNRGTRRKMSDVLRAALFALPIVALIVLAFVEIGMAYPVDLWVYALPATFLTVCIWYVSDVRSRWVKLTIASLLIVCIAVLYTTNWTTRKPFLRDLSKVKTGMTEHEARKIMQRYIEGSGFPANPLQSVNTTGTMQIVGSGTVFNTAATTTGELAISDSLIFRHATSGDFDADWGIVTLKGGVVTGTSFSPD